MESNSFLLSMASPVLHRMICGAFSEGMTRRVSLEEVDGKSFEEVLNLWCGKDCSNDKELNDVIVMASVADRLQMVEVVSALENAIIGQLCAGICAEVLLSSMQLGLRHVEAAAWGMAVDRFDEVSATEGFKGLDEETMGRLLEEDGLGVKKEEEAFEGLVRWMKESGGVGLRGWELLRGIRFGVMKQEYLEFKVREMLPEHVGCIQELVAEALKAKAALQAKVPVELQQLGAKALTRRRGRGVAWGRYIGDEGGRRLPGHSGPVVSLAEGEGRMFSGSLDGSIRVWRTETLEQERVLQSEDEDDALSSLAVTDGRVISGYSSGRIRVWDAASGERLCELEGHTDSVGSLCVLGPRLASGSDDSSIRVWTRGPGPEWQCERTFSGRRLWVRCLAGWEGKLISGSADKTIRIWDLETGVQDATLTGHDGVVFALLVHGRRLFSASKDGTIRAWAAGTWAALARVEAHGAAASRMYPRCLAASGPKLISGSAAGGGPDEGRRHEVRVWDADTLACEHTLRQPAGARVFCLAGTGGEVWGGVGSDVVVWGWD